MANQYTIYQVLPELYPHLVQIQDGTLYDGSGNLITEISGAGNGAQGPQGAGGVPSILNSTFSSVNIITITHSFGYYPVVQVLDQSYNLVTSFTVSHNSINDYTITFATSSSGLIITGAGTEGVQGTTGVQGFQGPQGITGFQGNTGPQGVQGTQGGLGGGTGSQGDTGPQGFQGESGPQGETGPQGFQGYTGPQGFQGYTGPQGFQGESGPQGFQGGTGPQGSNGISVSYYKYNARANSQTPPPNNSQIMWNNATQISSTIIYVSHLTRDGVDIDVFLALIKTNDSLILQDENNSNNYQKWTVNGAPTIIPNNYVSIPVTYIEGGYSFANGHDMIFVPLSIGIEGPQGFQGITGPQGSGGGSTGSQGSTGPQGFDGPQGLEGPQGFDGPQGFQGPTGPQGTNGTIGVNGSTGAQGFQGPTGPGFTTIYNYASTRILTASGSDAANAEENLTFDGSTLNVTGSVYISNSLTLASQVFYTHGNNGFSVNENFDISNNANQTAYHFTSGDPARDSVVFSLARTGNFTNMFGVYGVPGGNYFVIGSETSNTTFQIRSALGVQPVNLAGGDLLFEVTNNSLSAPTIQTGSTETDILVRDGSGNIFYRNDLSLVGPQGPIGATGANNPATNLFLFYNY